MKNISFYRNCSAEAGRILISVTLENDANVWGAYVKEHMSEDEAGTDDYVYTCGFYVIMWLVEGQAAVRCDGRDKVLARQKMLCLRPGVQWQWTKWDEARVVCFVFSEALYLQQNALLRKYLDQNVFDASDEMFFSHANSTERMVNTMMQMEYDRKHTKSDWHLQMLMVSQLGYLLERLAEMDTPEEHSRHEKVTDRERKMYADFCRMVERKYRLHWNMADYAKALGVCERLLYNSVKKMTGLSPFDIVNRRLYTEYLCMVADGCFDRNELAGRLGFTSHTAMRRWLSKRTIFSKLV